MTEVTQAQWSVKQLALLLLPLDRDSPPTTCPGDTNRVTFFSSILRHYDAACFFNEKTCLTPVQRADGGVMERDLCRSRDYCCMTCASAHMSFTSTLPLTMNQMRLAAEPCVYLRNFFTRIKWCYCKIMFWRTTCDQHRTLNICGARNNSDDMSEKVTAW